MIINTVNNSYNDNFKARRIAKTKNIYKGLTSHIDIYKLNENDKGFLKFMLSNFSLAKMLSNLEPIKIKLWQDILNSGLFNAMDDEKITYMAFSNNMPCGLLSMHQGKKLNLIDLVAIPIYENKKVNLSGLTLLYQAFLDASKKCKDIELEAVKNSPGNPVEKYKKLGMTEISSGERYVQMSSDQDNIKKQILRLGRKIQYRATKDKEVNLEKFIF